MKKNTLNKKNLLILIVIIAIVAVIGIIINANSKGTPKELKEVSDYVKNNYLNEATLSLIQSGVDNAQNKMSTAIISIKRDNGSKLKKISEQDVAKRYKELFDEDLKIEEPSFMLPNGYAYNYDDKTFDLFVEVGEELTEDDLKIDAIPEQQTGTFKVITSCTKVKKNEYEVCFEERKVKNASEFLSYAMEHQELGWDTAKLDEMTQKEENTEDTEYLQNLINDGNMSELTTVNKSGKITVKKDKNNYSIEKYEAN